MRHGILNAFKGAFTGSLKNKIRLGTIIITVTLVGLLALTLYWYERTELRSHYNARSQEHNRFIRLSLFQAMQSHQQDNLSEVLTRLAERETLQKVFIINPQGEIRFSSSLEEVGRRPSIDSPTCQLCHAQPSVRRENSVFFSENGRDSFRSVTLLENETRCQACHGTDHEFNGVLIADYNVAGYLDLLRTRGTRIFLGALLAAIGIMAAQRWLIFSVLVHRLHRLVQATGEKSVTSKGRASADEMELLLTRYEGLSRDLREALVTLRNHRDYLERIIDSLDDGLMVIDRDRKVRLVNRALLSRFGLVREDVLGQPCYPQLCLRSEESEDCPGGEFSGVVRMQDKEGQDIVLEVTTSSISSEADSAVEFVEVSRNITKRVELEERMRQAETLVQVGQLATGIAHEINNPLASMAACVDSLKRQLKNPDMEKLAGVDAFSRYLSLLEKEIYRCKKITHQVLSLARSPSSEKKGVSLGALIDETLSLLAYRLNREKCRVSLDTSTPVPEVLGDEGMLRQVLLNVLLNALDSLDKEPRKINIRLESLSGGEVALEISDTGVGIPEELRKEVLKPFVTTKAPGKGLGLGLSICRDIIREHQGTLILSSVLNGPGTVVRITLPEK